ncbi:MAG: septum formation protein Maf [Tissierellia bacterium]|nr:septum formation protein Maf [Tissierellia bacterium]
MGMLILASSSPRRIELLSRYDVEFETMKADIEERSFPGETPEEAAMALAFEKALQVAKGISPNSIVIGADTLVACEGRVMGKPKDEEEAWDMLDLLRGREHDVITGISTIRLGSNIKVIDFEKTMVRFGDISDEKLQRYIDTGEYVDKAGAYGIQGLGGVLIEGIYGCYFNVVGLPLYRLDNLLERYFDINLL